MASATLSPIPPVAPYLTYADYAAREKTSDTKHHFHQGRLIPMAGASYEHNTINANFAALLNAALSETNCHAVSSDMKVFVSGEAVYYPDTVMVCGSPRFDFNEALQNPLLIAEVLSPPTEDLDKGDKFSDYKTIASLQHIVFVEQNAPVVSHHENVGGVWTLRGEYTDLNQNLTLVISGAEVILPLSKIYRFVEFPSDEETNNDN